MKLRAVLASPPFLIRLKSRVSTYAIRMDIFIPTPLPSITHVYHNPRPEYKKFLSSPAATRLLTMSTRGGTPVSPAPVSGDFLNLHRPHCLCSWSLTPSLLRRSESPAFYLRPRRGQGGGSEKSQVFSPLTPGSWSLFSRRNPSFSPSFQPQGPRQLLLAGANLRAHSQPLLVPPGAY